MMKILDLALILEHAYYVSELDDHIEKKEKLGLGTIGIRKYEHFCLQGLSEDDVEMSDYLLK